MCMIKEVEFQGLHFSINNFDKDSICFSKTTLLNLSDKDLSNIKTWIADNYDNFIDFMYISEYIDYDLLINNKYKLFNEIKSMFSANQITGAIRSGEIHGELLEILNIVLNNHLNPYPPPIKNKLQSGTKKGYVYILKSENGLYKIGRAKNVDNRITDLGVKIPMRTELYFSCEVNDYIYSEKLLHNEFEAKRDHGEWFKLSEDDLVYAKELLLDE